MTGRIYLTGDTHGSFKRVKLFCRMHGLTEDDVVVILGDAGLNYYLADRDKHGKKLLERLPPKFLCLHGNHEERPYNLPQYREAQAFGGTVYVEDRFPHILFAKDGEVYDLGGTRCLVIGGAYSVDKGYRLQKGYQWFESEQPDDEIKRRVEAKLESCGWKVDVVLSHTVPLRFEPREAFIPQVDQSKVDKSTERWLGQIEAKLDYERWYAGHFHIEKQVERLRFMHFGWCRLWPHEDEEV